MSEYQYDGYDGCVAGLVMLAAVAMAAILAAIVIVRVIVAVVP